MRLWTDDNQPYDPRTSYGPTNDEKTVAKLLQVWNHCNIEYRDFLRRQLQVNEALADRPWTTEEYDYFKQQNRDPLHIPIMRIYEMHVSGLQRTSRSNFRVNPVDQESDPQLSEFVGDVLNSVSYNNHMPAVESMVFNDGQCGIGNCHVFESYDEDPMGEVRVEHADWASVYYDTESSKPTMTDCRYVATVRYFTANELRNMFMNKVNHLQFNEDEFKEWWNNLQGMIANVFSISGHIVDRQNGLFAVLELHERVKQREKYVIDVATGRMMGKFEAGDKNMELFHQLMPTAAIVPRMKTYMKVTRVLPYMNVVLEESMKPYGTYGYIPYLSRRVGDTRIPKCSSYMYGILGLQREVNLRHSNIQEIIVRSIRGGSWVFDQALLTQMDAEGNKIGKNYYVDDPEKVPKAISDRTLPSGLAYLEEGSLRMFELTTGLSVQPMGKSEFAGESGIHRAEKRKESQTTLYPMLEAFDHQRALVGEAILDRIVNQLTIPRSMRIVGNDEKVDFQWITQELINQLKDIKRWDIRIEEGPFAVTQKREQQLERLDLFELMARTFSPKVLKPGDLLIGSSLPNSKEIATHADERWLALLEGEGGEPVQ